MPARREPSTAAVLAAAITASVLVHLVLWPLGDEVVQWKWGSAPLPRSDGVMQVSLLPIEQESPPREPEAEELDELLDDDSKLVKLDELLEEKPPPPDTPYVSEFDSRVDKQTRAPKQRPRPGAPSNPTGDRPDAQRDAQEQSTSQQRDPSTKPLPLQGRSAGERGEGEDSERAMTDAADDGRLASNAGRAGGAPSPRGLAGVPDSLRRQWGTPGTYDDLGELEEDDANRLNARRFKYASFFNRVRDAVAEHWHPEVLHAARDPEGRVHGTKTRITKLLISLNDDGSVHRVRLVRTSDVDYLDEEAIRAVRAAQPFTNPPPQLVDRSSGKIEFGFAFIFEINGGRRIFRYRK